MRALRYLTTLCEGSKAVLSLILPGPESKTHMKILSQMSMDLTRGPRKQLSQEMLQHIRHGNQWNELPEGMNCRAHGT